MSQITGTWNLEVKTPTGPQKFVLAITDEPLGAERVDEAGVDFYNVALEGDTATFEGDTDKPMKLHMIYTLVADGDDISGTVKPGPFPNQKIVGSRA
ncbi:hypothetical protein [Microbacterium thalassium]|uniref:Uncharacterized protein n=1 Tax=Microbacterium thalassium TaxID=362649 RepID=A0A7X0FN43_9MICO|nr:hypothetical protein [Microbacterium thalassium]MBB6390501.1 hypothetical protein [Microbacterium thalassium]GLK25612.1 hypothetical protein GCM10017607_29310 [Microbacterium thalassium]